MSVREDRVETRWRVDRPYNQHCVYLTVIRTHWVYADNDEVDLDASWEEYLGPDDEWHRFIGPQIIESALQINGLLAQAMIDGSHDAGDRLVALVRELVDQVAK
jgi:hypothetical protein